MPAVVLGREVVELTLQERAVLEAHPANGAELARGSAIPDEACDWIAATAERFDGSGLARLAGERIPLESRIVVAACACDAALSGCSAGAQESAGIAIARLREAAGRELDPRAVGALAAVLERVRSRA